MNSDILVHFHPDEHHFVDKAWEWVGKAAKTHKVKQTDFLDPRQAFILQSLVNREPDTALSVFGGYDGAERKRAIVAPDYVQVTEDDYGIAVLKITSPDTRFASLEHGDFLGALTGLGIKRDKLGDIHKAGEACYCLIAVEIGDYIDMQLRQVHRVQVFTEIVPTDQLKTVRPELDEMSFTVASLRLDGIVSDVYRLSRAKVLAPIKAGKCRVNWKVEEDPSTPVREGDVVSFQGFGRFKIIEIEGLTKKGRLRVRIGKFV